MGSTTHYSWKILLKFLLKFGCGTQYSKTENCWNDILIWFDNWNQEVNCNHIFWRNNKRLWVLWYLTQRWPYFKLEGKRRGLKKNSSNKVHNIHRLTDSYICPLWLTARCQCLEHKKLVLYVTIILMMPAQYFTYSMTLTDIAHVNESINS